MKDVEKEASEEQREKFEDLESFGEASAEEFSGLQERLGAGEKIKMISTAKLKSEHKSLICLTDKRLILFSSDKAKILGKRSKFEDIRLEDIQDIEVEEREGFDKIWFKNRETERELSTPEGRGVRIAGLIRGQQDIKEKEPAEQLEKLGEQREKGNITEEEYEDKKKDLMDRI